MHFGKKLGHSKQKNSMGILSSLTREQKEAVGLLQIGTFLEYFDLMLYVHMAVLLNELFFPKTDPHTASLLAAFAFCSTWIFRPFGALLFGWIGDNIGRKTTVVITTIMMSFSCVVMANLPTYEQIGISAAWIITACRIIQGLSSMGEIKGAEIYLAEITKPPARYPVVAFISVASDFGSMAALALAFFVTSIGFDWRVAFWFGATVALAGSIARTRLRETPDFLSIKTKKNNLFINNYLKEKVDKKTILSYFFIECAWPVSFFFVFFYSSLLLKTKFNCSANEIIHQNLIVSLVALFSSFLFASLSYTIHPLKILKSKLLALSIFCLLVPPLLFFIDSPFQMLILQCIFIFFALSGDPGYASFIMQFPIHKRFMFIAVLYSIAAAFMHIITSFGMIYLTDFFGHYGLWFIMIPMCVSFFYALNHFIKLEKASGNFPEYRVSEKLSAIR